ncbi:hypothetical protein [Vibrio sp. MA40-2]|uniref:hypothetical protein n=1 Tax=Vibrio sp. MA40-2 TaxID=3391828 RepID=UPI0039A63953
MATTAVKKNINSSINLIDYAMVLAIVCVIALISNWAGTGTTPLSALPGMAIIFAMVIMSLAIAKIMPFYLPSVAWLSLVSVLLTIPASPLSEPILTYVKDIDFLSLVSPVLAYAGIAITKQEITTFKTAGIKIVVIAILIFTGTFVGSTLVANALL